MLGRQAVAFRTIARISGIDPFPISHPLSKNGFGKWGAPFHDDSAAGRQNIRTEQDSVEKLPLAALTIV
jgi:hypothetical protein